MCCRYYMSDELKDRLEEELQLFGGYKLNKENEKGKPVVIPGEVTPGMRPLVLRSENGGEIIPDNVYWGYEGPGKGLIINSRSESVFEKRMFADGIKNHRCVVPASVFYEWDADRTKVGFNRRDEKPIYMAGICTADSTDRRFSVLTTAADESVKGIHDRMPVILEKEEVGPWLTDGSLTESFLIKKNPPLDNDREYEQLSLF
ncbi:MAG: SOS response-associated peptidase family protein [Eubacteriales bacterium]|nr:SOS response-associated peptidase family protein [Eubacteriales bacterium]